MKNIILLILFSISFCSIEISGDARLRPRYDIKKYADGTNTYDLYYMYRARLNFNSDIGDGWFFKSRIGYNGAASISKMADDNVTLWSDGNLNAGRPLLSFLNLYLGRKLDSYGFWGGALPIKGNPAMDIHFYPDKILDIPWTIYNNESVTGFAGYYNFGSYRIDTFLTVDNNVINNTEVNGNSNTLSDMQTFGLNVSSGSKDASFNFRYLQTFAENSIVKPTTIGFDISYFPSQSNIFTFSYYVSTSYNVVEYDIIFTRLKAKFPKIGPGSLTMWYDVARKEYVNQNYDDIIFLCSDDCMKYIWLSYDYMIYKSDAGSINITPTVRIQNGKYESNHGLFDKDYSRSKYELTINYKFK